MRLVVPRGIVLLAVRTFLGSASSSASADFSFSIRCKVSRALQSFLFCDDSDGLQSHHDSQVLPSSGSDRG